MYLIYICKYICIHTYIITEIHVSGQIIIIHQPRAPLILLSTSPLLGTMPHLDKCETFFKLSLQCSPKCRVEINKMWNYPRLIVRKKDLCCITRTFQRFVISVWSLSNCRMLICFWHSGTFRRSTHVRCQLQFLSTWASCTVCTCMPSAFSEKTSASSFFPEIEDFP